MTAIQPARKRRRKAIPHSVGMAILIDTREQQPYEFRQMPSDLPYAVFRTTLDAGDYLCDRRGAGGRTPATCAAVERKSLTDLYGTASRGRQRFEAELARMQPYGFKCIVIEAEWSAILQPNRYLVHPTNMRPKSMLASLLAWGQRYGVHIYTCPGRAVAERIVFRLLERWYKDGARAGGMEGAGDQG